MIGKRRENKEEKNDEQSGSVVITTFAVQATSPAPTP
jgi:hypothetical protein